MIHLASPYSNPSTVVRDMRFREACRAAGRLMHEGHAVFSPIAHSHFMDTEPHAPFEVYQEMDEAMIRVCDEMWIYADSGWQESCGVTSERRYAERLGIPIRLINFLGEFVPNDHLLLEAS